MLSQAAQGLGEQKRGRRELRSMSLRPALHSMPTHMPSETASALQVPAPKPMQSCNLHVGLPLVPQPLRQPSIFSWTAFFMAGFS